MEIKRESNDDYKTFDYELLEGDKTLSIYLGPDCALHFLLKNANNEKSLEETFTITKENILLYNAFKETYLRVINNDIYEPSASKIAACQCADDYASLEQVAIQQKSLIDELCQKEYNILVKENGVTWYSESEDYQNRAHFTIEKGEDSFYLHFQKKKTPNKRWDYSVAKEFLDVRVGIKDSHFFPYNIAFINLYKRLQILAPSHKEEIHLSMKKDTA